MRKVPQRRILILGCGALGGALVNSFCAHADTVVVDPFSRVRVRRRIIRDIRFLEGQSFDGVIVATKCYDLDQSLSPLKNCINVKRFLFLQNGIFDLTRLKRLFPLADFVRGITTSAVGIVSLKPVFFYSGEFFFSSEDDKRNSSVGWFRGLFEGAGLKVSLVRESKRIVWAKLIFSAVMNPLPVMTGQGYDVLKTDPKIWGLVQQAVDEGREVVKCLGIRLAFDPMRIIKRVRNGDLMGMPHRGSIYQDVVARHQTELDFITGALVREARAVGLRTPALNIILRETKVMGAA